MILYVVVNWTEGTTPMRLEHRKDCEEAKALQCRSCPSLCFETLGSSEVALFDAW